MLKSENSEINKCITLVGDTTLDNFNYLKNKNNDLCHCLKAEGFKVVNVAVFGSKLNDLLNGCNINEKHKKRKYCYDIGEDGRVKQLKLFSNKKNCTLSNKHDKSKIHDMTVLSIGGHDLENDPMKIIRGIDCYVESILTATYERHYDQILSKITSLSHKTLLLTIYLPYAGVGSIYYLFNSIAKNVVTKMNNFIIKKAKQHGVPVFDLFKSVDSSQRSCFGTQDLYLSDTSCVKLAKCIEKIYKYYKGHRVYYAKNLDPSLLKYIKNSEQSQNSHSLRSISEINM